MSRDDGEPYDRDGNPVASSDQRRAFVRVVNAIEDVIKTGKRWDRAELIEALTELVESLK